jgi:polyhydroxyalkanoate synthase
LVKADVTFLLTSGGHNVGIVNPPGVPGRSFQILARRQDEPCQDPDAWLAEAPSQEGSWWPAWEAWLQGHAGKRVAPPGMGNDSAGHPVLDVAPGRYVLAA